MGLVQAPTFFVSIKPTGSNTVRLNLGERLLSLEYEDHERKADQLKLVLQNEDLVHFDDPILRKGNRVLVSWGYPGNFSPPREVVITKIEGFRQLTVEALDKGILLNKFSRSECFENVTRAEVAQIIAERNGFGADQQFIQETGIVYPTIAQARLTDAQMMRRLARKEGYEFFIDFDGFHFHERVLEQAPIRSFVYYNAIDNPTGILDISINNDVYAKPGRIRTKAIDPDTKQVVEGVGDNDTTSRKGTGEKAELFLTRDVASDVGLQLEIRQVDAGDWSRPAAVQGETGRADVKRDADKRYRRAAQTSVEMMLSVIGDPSLIAKTVIRVEGVGKRLTGNYYVRSANHNVKVQGYTTTLDLISDGTKGYVQPGDILLSEEKQNKKPVEPENKADKNDKDTKDPRLLLQRSGADEAATGSGIKLFIDTGGRQNLPGEPQQ